MAARAQSTAVTIRPAHESDLDDVAAIERSVFNDPWSRRSFADLVDARQVLFLVASDTNAVVGYAIVLTAGVESELANLAVSRLVAAPGTRAAPACRGVQPGARRAGARRCFSRCRASNEAAIQLYKSAGFEAVGRRARYYARPIEDAIVMRAGLK